MSAIISVMGCRKCGKCRSICDAIEHTESYVRIDHDKCNLCMRCVVMCPNKALKLIEI